MHHIKKLEIVGFKSFCDKIQVVFNEGITGIVGPNGCGKSNIADAISWVVGAQSAKSLRTDKMEGVIFNGTQARKATSMAEVVLTLSLTEKFPVPASLNIDPENVTVGRRLYRSGESEYYLDGRRCRLKDIQLLLEGTGLGPNSYALIEQGRTAQILSSKPADRRALIEEAARITLFKSRRYSAEIKLEAAQQNLLRVGDIIREVVRQLNSLRRQAAKARRYNRLREELRNVQKLKFGMEQREIVRKLTECTERFVEAQAREQSMVAELSRLEISRTSSQEDYQKHELGIEDIRDRLSTIRLESSNVQNARQNFEFQSQELTERLKDLEREYAAIGERGQIIEREQERLKLSTAGLSEEIAREQQKLDAEHSRNEMVHTAIREAEARIEELRSSLLSGAGRLADLKNLQARCEESLQRLSVSAGRLENECASKATERNVLLAQLEGARMQREGIASRQHELSELAHKFERESAELGVRLEAVAVEMTAEQEEFSLRQNRLASLEEVERRRSNYSEGVQKYLAARVPGEEAVSAQTLADQIETDTLYETAVEDYLNDPLQYILVDGIDAAVRSVERLRRVGAGKCTFMTLRNGHVHEQPVRKPAISGDGVLGYLDDMLRMKEDVRQAFERVLPEFASTVMVSDLQSAFRVAESHPDNNFLTLAGEAYSPRGTLSAVGERKSMAGFLALKREKRELEVKLESLRLKIQATRDEMSRVKAEQTCCSENLKSLTNESRKVEVELVVAQHQLERLEEETAKLDQAEKVARLELSQLMSEKEELETKLRDASAGIADIEERSRTGNEELRELSARLESLRSESAAMSKNLAVLISAHAVKQERRSGMETELRRLTGEMEEVGKRSMANRSEKSASEARLADLHAERQNAEVQIERLASLIEETERSLQDRQKELALQREALARLEEAVRRLHGEREAAMEARGKVEIEKTRLESDLEHLEKSCQEEFHQSLPEVVAQIDEDGWQREYREVAQYCEELRNRIENFGAINMRALEEYQELDERYQFLSKQRSDIEQSIADTQKAIAEINRRSIEQFKDAFKNIRENFMEVFQILFRGGQCDLRLLDDGDVLESGIDIIAQPPGKRLQNVLLLSGGEKTLTALALLIAIFRYRPSPFCVLDEVDAPLDDANISRFTQLLMELSKETQYILITHNKRTMEIAQTLYGVTMEEPGVSKIVGVDFRNCREAIA
jgi:chromosome segregation protein